MENVAPTKIQEKLNEWVYPEGESENKILSLVYSQDKKSAYALVLYGEAVEIDYLFYIPYIEKAELSCDKTIQLPFSEPAKKEAIAAIEQTFATLMHRWR